MPKSPPPKPKRFATPETAAEYWRRNRVFKRISLAIAGFLILVCVGVKSAGSDKAFAFTALFGATIWFGVITVFNIKYRVCPECKTVFGRGHQPGYCDKCETGFPREGERKDALPPA